MVLSIDWLNCEKWALQTGGYITLHKLQTGGWKSQMDLWYQSVKHFSKQSELICTDKVCTLRQNTFYCSRKQCLQNLLSKDTKFSALCFTFCVVPVASKLQRVAHLVTRNFKRCRLILWGDEICPTEQETRLNPSSSCSQADLTPSRSKCTASFLSERKPWGLHEPLYVFKMCVRLLYCVSFKR